MGAGLSHAFFGTYILLSTKGVNLIGYEWIPVVSFGAVLLIAGVGAIPVPYIILVEILPEKVIFT